MLRNLITLIVTSCTPTIWGQTPSAPPPAQYALIEGLRPSVSATAQTWLPMIGSAPVETVSLTGQPVLRLPCNFQAEPVERASWDRAVQLDLSNCQGLQLQLYCDNLTPISAFTLYCQSGSGWYANDFALEEAGQWVTVSLDKRRFHTEGHPDGWSTIRTLRLSVWQGQRIDTTLYLAHVGLLNAEAPVVIVQDSPERQAEGEFTNLLSDLAIPSLVLRPTELFPTVLANRSLLILAQAKPLSGSAHAAAMAFLERHAVIATQAAAGNLAGAKLRKVEALPQSTRPLIELIASLEPKLASQAVKDSIEHLGQFGPYATTGQARQALEAFAPGNNAVKVALEQAEQLQAQAVESASHGKSGEAVEQITRARTALMDAYCSAQAPLAGEQRLFWCHDAFGVKGMEWDAAVKILADNGFTGIIPNMLWGGVAYYRSDVLPVAPEVATQGDQIEKCTAACRKYGIACHVWKVNWYMSGRSPAEFRSRMKAAGRTQENFDGSPQDDWLCPSSPENRQLEIDSMLEVARRYDVDGVHFDYIRYPDNQTCFCDRCRELFEKQIGRRVAHWPSDVRTDATLRESWLAFRRGNITPVVAAVAETIHKNHPNVKVSAAVWPFWNNERDNIGQDWKDWCDKGYLDFVCPMDYRQSNSQFRNMIRLQQPWAGKVPCYPGIGESLWEDRDITRLIDQIKITRELNTGGFTIFNYAMPQARRTVPLCGKGITRREQSPQPQH